LLTIYSSAAYFFFNNGMSELKPLYFYIVVYVCGAYAYLTSPGAGGSFRRHFTLVGLLALLVIATSIQFLIFDISAAGLDLYIGRIHFFLTLIAFFLLLGSSSRLGTVIDALKWIVVASCAINVAEFFYIGPSQGWMSTVPGRAAGFFENANDSAMFIALAIPIVAVTSSSRVRWLFYLVTFVGISVTFSRGGIVCWATFVAIAEIMLGLKRNAWGSRVFLAAITVVGIVALVSNFSSDFASTVTEMLSPYLDANTGARLSFEDSYSTNERAYVFQRGMQAFFDAPFFGQGIGYTHSWDASGSVHNMIVLMLAELGLVGGIWFVLFIVSLWVYGRPFGVAIAVVLLVSSLFTHNHLERPALAMAIAIYALAAERLRSSHVAQSSPGATR